MERDQSIENQVDDRNVLEGIVEPGKDSLPFLASELQLQNVFTLEMIARRFPVEVVEIPVAQLSIERVGVNEELKHGQAVLSVSMEFTDEPHPFEISFKLLGEFEYAPQVAPEEITYFLEKGSLSVLLPFARELLLSICTRLQVPPILLSMVKLTPPLPFEAKNTEDLVTEQ